MQTEAVMAWHLSRIAYPPVNPRFVPVALAAVRKVDDGNGRQVVTAPGGITMTANEMVELFRLGVFLRDPERW